MRQQSIFLMPNQRSMTQILMLPCLILAKWSQRKAWLFSQSGLWKPEVSQWGLKWQPLWGKYNVRSTPRQSGIPWLGSSRCRLKCSMNSKASSLPCNSLMQSLGLLLQPKQGDVKKKEGETPKKAMWGRNRGNSVLTHQASGAKNKRNLTDS